MSEAATLRLRLILTRRCALISTKCEMSKKEAVWSSLKSASFRANTKGAHAEIINEGDEHAEEKPEKDEKKLRKASIHAEELK